MKYIVMTSIFRPTKSVNKFSAMSNYKLIVVGDKKTPSDWQCNNVIFLPIENVNLNDIELASKIPQNHYARKMLGYAFAIQNGASIIIDTDDDNIPYDDFGFPNFEGNFNFIKENGFINIYNYFTEANIWPRGLPLELINSKKKINAVSKDNFQVGVWQGLADDDPDVDAIYRLTNDKSIFFEKREPVVLKPNTLSPFNSQNTAIIKDLFSLLYLPTTVTFRFTDILRGLVAQPIMWLYGYCLGFTNATVRQVRNPHDYTKDFMSEIPMYQHTQSVVNIVSNAIDKSRSLQENLLTAYSKLADEQIVLHEELDVLQTWLKLF